MRIQQSKKQLLIYYMAGFVVGVFYANLIAGKYLAATGILSDYFLNQYANTEIVVEDYVIYILRVRLFPLAALLILSNTKFRKPAVIATLLWTGFSTGLILVESVIKLGVKGILLCVIGITPQFICYIMAYFVVLWHLYAGQTKKWYMGKAVFVAISMLLGIVLEGYVNPVLLKMFVKVL